MSQEILASPGRSRALDGLRGLAILLVLAYHLPVVTTPDGHDHALPGGWLGVDLFFVLSGYLITAHMLREHARTAGIDRRAFYHRRWLRLGPALLAVLVAWTVLALVGVMPVPVPPAVTGPVTPGVLAAPWLSAATLSSNWWILLGPGLPVSMAHLWSLAIEEQFYLLWPSLLVLALGLGRRRGWSAPRVVLAIAIPASLLCLAAVPLVASATSLPLGLAPRQVLYFAAWTRVPAILGGAAVAAVMASGWRPSPRATRVVHYCSLVAWALLAVAWLTAYDSSTEIVAVVIPLAALGGTAILAHVVTTPAAPGTEMRGFGRAWIVWFGRRSYALYLWNWPWTVAATQHLQGLGALGQAVVSVGLTLACGELSWRLVESRWQRPRTTRPPRRRSRVDAYGTDVQPTVTTSAQSTPRVRSRKG